MVLNIASVAGTGGPKEYTRTFQGPEHTAEARRLRHNSNDFRSLISLAFL